MILLLWDTRILIPKGMIACMPSLLSMLTSGSHEELPDCILIIFLPCSTYSVVLPSVVPSTVFYNPCSFYLYPDCCCCLYSGISYRAPEASDTQAFTSTCSLCWLFTFPLVLQPWVQTLAAPLPLQRTSLGPQGSFFRRTQWHYSTSFSLNTGNHLASPANWEYGI